MKMNYNHPFAAIFDHNGCDVASRQNLYALLRKVETTFELIIKEKLASMNVNEAPADGIYACLPSLLSDVERYRDDLKENIHFSLYSDGQVVPDGIIPGGILKNDNAPFRFLDIKNSPLQQYYLETTTDLSKASQFHSEGCLIFVSDQDDVEKIYTVEIYSSDCPDEIFDKYRRAAEKDAEVPSYSIEWLADRLYVKRLSTAQN